MIFENQKCILGLHSIEMKIIYDYLIRDLYLSWGIFINSLFLDSQIALFIFLFVVLCFLSYMLLNNSFKYILFFMIASGILFYLILIIPFYKGRIINQYFEYGEKIIISIEEYRNLNSYYPESLSSLTIQNLDNKNFKNLENGFKYIPYYKKYDTQNKPLPEIRFIENYSLNLKIPNFNSPLYTYNKTKHSFMSD